MDLVDTKYGINQERTSDNPMYVLMCDVLTSIALSRQVGESPQSYMHLKYMNVCVNFAATPTSSGNSVYAPQRDRSSSPRPLESSPGTPHRSSGLLMVCLSRYLNSCPVSLSHSLFSLSAFLFYYLSGLVILSSTFLFSPLTPSHIYVLSFEDIVACSVATNRTLVPLDIFVVCFERSTPSLTF